MFNVSPVLFSVCIVSPATSAELIETRFADGETAELFMYDSVYVGGCPQAWLVSPKGELMCEFSYMLWQEDLQDEKYTSLI